MAIRESARVADQPIHISEPVIHAMLDDEALVLNVETGLYFGFGDIGARIWELLVAGSTEERLVAQLLDEYDVDEDHLRADVREFLQRLASKGLISYGEQSGAE